jgi:ABC-type uncharacterized transport system involved in gliding motility auxiliary subunit
MGGALQARPVRSGLENLLPAYGVRIDEDLALDNVCATAGFTSGYMRFMVRYPYWPRIVKQDFDQTNPIVSKLESLVLPWVSPVEESEMKPAAVTFTKLAWTSDQSWTQSGPFNLAPQQQWMPDPSRIKSYGVVAALTGQFQSYFAGKDIPPAPADTTAGVVPTPPDEPLIDLSTETQLLVVGTSQFINANFLSQYPSNITFFLNALDWMALGDELIAIRSRTVSDRPLDPEILKDEAAGKRSAIKYAGIFGMPILLTIFGIGQWMARRRGKQTFESALRGPSGGTGSS